MITAIPTPPRVYLDKGTITPGHYWAIVREQIGIVTVEGEAPFQRITSADDPLGPGSVPVERIDFICRIPTPERIAELEAAERFAAELREGGGR